MPNNYSTLIQERSSHKFYLVRIRPARNITSLLSLYSGTTYEMTFDVPYLPKLEVNGSDYTKVSSATPSSGQFYFNRDTKLLRVNLGAALTTQIVVGFYYLFFTNDIYRRANEEPVALTGEFFDFDPRIASDPGFSMNQKNVMFGTISINSTSLDLKNTDKYFQTYLTDNDSFYNKEIVFWHCIDSVDNVAQVYKGTISDYSLSNDLFQLSIDSEFKAFQKTKFSSFSFDQSFFLNSTYTDMDDLYNLKPIRRMIQRLSKCESNSDPYAPALSAAVRAGADTRFAGASYLRLTGETYQAINLDTGTGTTQNRVWGCYIGETNSQNYSATVSSVVAHIPNTAFGWNLYDVAFSNAADYENIFVGDTLTSNTVPNYPMHVMGRGPGYFLIARHAGGALSNGDILTRPEISQVQIECSDIQKNGENLFLPLVHGTDYTIASIGGNLRTINLVANFEAAFAEFTAVKASIENNYIVRYVAHTNTTTDNLNHAKYLKGLIEELGLSTNAASFTTAGSEATLLNFTIPFFGDEQMPTYLDVIEKILESTGGYITLNNSNEIEYHLISAPTSPSVVSEDVFIKGSLTQSLDFNDVYSTIKFKNNHGSIYNYKARNAGVRAGSGIYLAYPYLPTIEMNQETDSSVTYLHGIARTLELENILDGYYSTTAFDRVKKLRFHRIGKYRFRTKINSESILGDSFQLSTDRLMGSNTKDVRLFSKTQRKVDSELEGYDLLGF